MNRDRLIRRFNRRARRATKPVLVMLLAVTVTIFMSRARSILAESEIRRTKISAGVVELPERSASEMITFGDSLFHAKGSAPSCSFCHGDDGTGSAHGPRLTNSRKFVRGGNVESIRRAIRFGVLWPPSVLPSMPAYDEILSDEQVTALAAYVHSISGRSKS